MLLVAVTLRRADLDGTALDLPAAIGGGRLAGRGNCGVVSCVSIHV